MSPSLCPFPFLSIFLPRPSHPLIPFLLRTLTPILRLHALRLHEFCSENLRRHVDVVDVATSTMINTAVEAVQLLVERLDLGLLVRGMLCGAVGAAPPARTFFLGFQSFAVLTR